jgi:iron complex outermembrane receptor protein
MVTDVFASYKVCKAATIYIGADNIMNVHPDFGILQAARGYGSDNESGGPWDSVQMGFNGRRLFAKRAFSF